MFNAIELPLLMLGLTCLYSWPERTRNHRVSQLLLFQEEYSEVSCLCGGYGERASRRGLIQADTLLIAPVLKWSIGCYDTKT